MNKKLLSSLRQGDKVKRFMDGDVMMELTITNLKGGLIICGDWTFDSNSGSEIDDFLGWDGNHSGSWIEPK